MKMGKRIPESLLNKTGAFISDLFWKLFRFLKPDPVVWKGAGWGLAGMVIILILVMAAIMLKSLGVMAAVFLVLFISAVPCWLRPAYISD